MYKDVNLFYFRTGLCHTDYAYEFLKDLQGKLASMTQLTINGHRMYREAVGGVFGAGILIIWYAG